GLAARHHGIGRDAYRRRRTEARRDLHHRLVEIAVAIGEHAFDALGRGRNDGQAVAPAFRAQELVNRLGIVVAFEHRAGRFEQGRQRGHDCFSFTTFSSCGSATAARSRTFSMLSPPSGCWIRRSGRSGTPNTFACAVPSFMNESEHTTAAINPRLVNW